MYKPTIWQFSDLSVRMVNEASSPFSADSIVMRSQHLPTDGFTEPISKLIGQRFSIGLSEELHLRGLVANDIAMRAVIAPEEPHLGRSRTRVELVVILQVPRATQNDLIDALVAAKRRCSMSVGPDIKILLRAELKMSESGICSRVKSSA